MAAAEKPQAAGARARASAPQSAGARPRAPGAAAPRERVTAAPTRTAPKRAAATRTAAARTAPTKPALYGQLFVSFLKVGVFAFGGGASVIPILHQEVVKERGWLDEAEFLDAYTLGSSMPGPVGSNLAGYVGFHVAGWPGALVSLAASTLLGVAAMIALAALYLEHRSNPVVQGFLLGVRPVVIALLAAVVWEFIPAALGRPREWRRHRGLWLLALLASVLAIGFDAHPALLISLGGLTGLLLLR